MPPVFLDLVNVPVVMVRIKLFMRSARSDDSSCFYYLLLMHSCYHRIPQGIRSASDALSIGSKLPVGMIYGK